MIAIRLMKTRYDELNISELDVQIIEYREMSFLPYWNVKSSLV